MSLPVVASTPTIADLIDLTGRTAVVTGGAKGIGLGIATRLHEAGAAVLIADLDVAASAQVVDRLNAERSASARAIRTDVGNAEDVAAMVAEAIEGSGRLDILVNDAGIFPMQPFLEMEPEDFERVLRVNLLGVFLTMKAAAQQMIAQGHGGRIINVTSIDALHPSMIGLAHYDASKHGVWGLTKNVALELAPHGIAVNALAPGGVTTPGTGDGADPSQTNTMEQRIPMRRMATPDEMGRVALFLASDLSTYLTGSQIVADGGMLLS